MPLSTHKPCQNTDMSSFFPTKSQKKEFSAQLRGLGCGNESGSLPFTLDTGMSWERSETRSIKCFHSLFRKKLNTMIALLLNEKKQPM